MGILTKYHPHPLTNRSWETFTPQVLRQIRNASPKSSTGTSAKPLDKVSSKGGYGSNKTGEGKKIIGEYPSSLALRGSHS